MFEINVFRSGSAVLAGVFSSVFAISGAQAATVEAGIGGGFVAYANTYVPTDTNPDNVEAVLIDSTSIDDTRTGNFDAAPGSVQVSDGFNTSGDSYSAEGSYSASGDTAKGELKASNSTSVNAFAPPPGADETEVRNGDEFATGNGAGASISEVFTLDGSGTATFSALVDVSWNGNIRFDGFVRARNLQTGQNYLPTLDQQLRIRTTGLDSDPATGSVTDHLISVAIDFAGVTGEQIEVFWDIGGFSYASDYCYAGDNCQASNTFFNNAMFDASGTANIYYSATGGLDVFSTSDGFLRDSQFQTYSPGTQQVVPLPAAGFLLVGGLAGLGIVGRRRRKVT